MRNKLCLGASDAQKIVAAAKVEAENNKWAVSIAVVDDGGFLVALERLDGAVGQSAGIATLKAQTAAMARTPTKALEDVVKERPGDRSVSRKAIGAGRSSDHCEWRMRRRGGRLRRKIV